MKHQKMLSFVGPKKCQPSLRTTRLLFFFNWESNWELSTGLGSLVSCLLKATVLYNKLFLVCEPDRLWPDQARALGGTKYILGWDTAPYMLTQRYIHTKRLCGYHIRDGWWRPLSQVLLNQTLSRTADVLDYKPCHPQPLQLSPSLISKGIGLQFGVVGLIQQVPGCGARVVADEHFLVPVAKQRHLACEFPLANDPAPRETRTPNLLLLYWWQRG